MKVLFTCLPVYFVYLFPKKGVSIRDFCDVAKNFP